MRKGESVEHQRAIGGTQTKSSARHSVSTERLRAAFDGMAVGMILKGAEGETLESNPALRRMLGYGEEELRGMVRSDYTHPEDAGRDAELYRQLLAGERDSFRMEKRYVRKDGGIMWGRLSVSRIEGAEGEPAFAVGVVEDITEIREANQEIERLHRQNRLILDSAGEGIYGLDPEGNTTFVNPAAAAMTGYEPEDMIGKSQHEIVHHSYPDGTSYPEDECPIYAALTDGEIHHVNDEVFWRKDGTQFPVEYTSTPILEDGEVVGAVVTFTDITERKESREALEGSEERYRIQSRELALLHHVRSALARELDLTSVFRTVVEATAETYGYTQVSAYLLEGENLLLQHQVGYERLIERIPISKGVSGRTVRTGKPVLLEDVRADPDFLGAIGGITSEICVPLFDEGRAVGFFNVESMGGVTLTQKDLKLMVALGEHISVAVSRARLHTRVRNSEEHFRALTQNSSDLITLLSAVGTIRYQSPSMERILGYRPEETIGDNAFDYIHPEDRERAEMAFAEGLVDPGRRPSVEYRFLHKGGSWVWLESMGSNLLDDPEVGEYVVNSRDVTGRKEAERALKESEERYRSLMEQSVEAIYLFDSETKRVLESNAAFRRLMGYTDEDLLQMRIYDFVAHDPDNIDYNVKRSLEEKRRYIGERRYRRKDGSVILVDTSASVVYCDGRLALCAVSRDVTERRESEEAVRRSEARLAEAQRLAHLGGWEWDVRTDEISWSDEVYHIYGLEPQSSVPSLERFMTAVHPDDRNRVTKTIDEALEGIEPYDVEHRVVRPNGEVRVVHRRAEVLRGEGGEPLKMIGTVHDITERKEAEKRLREAEERYRTVVEQQTELVCRFLPDLTVTFVNEAYCRYFGVETVEVLGKSFIGRVAAEARVHYEEQLARLNEENPRRTVEHRVLTPDGGVRWQQWTDTVIFDDEGSVVEYQSVGRDVTERRALEERLEHQAFHDPLTGLPNRRLFVDRLGQALGRTRRRKGRRVAVLFMDLDNFKGVNDSLGHEVGDRLLVAVAERLKGCLRPEDTLARFGGDEFVVLVEDVVGPDEAVRVAERIGEGFGSPFRLEGRELYTRASIGIALGDARDKTSEDLLRDADTAMYRTKEGGSGHHSLFDSAMYERAVGRLELENDLRRAIEQGEFVVHYQPIVRLDDGAVWGVEALVRWEHPGRGLLDPGEFVPVAEESGLVVPMGKGVLRDACRRARVWQEKPPHLPPLVMSVNLSAKQLGCHDFAEAVEEVLRETGLEAGCLSLDVTETVYVRTLEGSTGALGRLRSMGVGISIDDFGTGYSSLAYLKRLPADALKIDMSFVRGLGKDAEGTAIVRMVVKLAHTLGMKVIAEGVETEEQAAMLREMCCDLGQGYHFSKPLPPDEVPGFLAG